jgi:hypothetical protein
MRLHGAGRVNDAGNVMKKDRWRDVKVMCEKPKIGENEVPVHFAVPRVVTNRMVMHIMRMHFTDGPRAAQRAQAEYTAWFEGMGKGVDAKLSVRGSRWDGFMRSVEEWINAQELKGIKHGIVWEESVDFSGLNQKRSLRRSL